MSSCLDLAHSRFPLCCLGRAALRASDAVRVVLLIYQGTGIARTSKIAGHSCPLRAFLHSRSFSYAPVQNSRLCLHGERLCSRLEARASASASCTCCAATRRLSRTWFSIRLSRFIGMASVWSLAPPLDCLHSTIGIPICKNGYSYT